MHKSPAYRSKADTRELAATSLKAFSTSLFSVGSSLKSAGTRAGQGILQAVSVGYEQLTAENTDREHITFAKFSHLPLNNPAGRLQRPVLLLGYQNGFQVWDLEDSDDYQELVSRRDGAVRYLGKTCEHSSAGYTALQQESDHGMLLQFHGASANIVCATCTLQPSSQCMASSCNRICTSRKQLFSKHRQIHFCTALRTVVLNEQPLICALPDIQEPDPEPEMQLPPHCCCTGLTNPCIRHQHTAAHFQRCHLSCVSRPANVEHR